MVSSRASCRSKRSSAVVKWTSGSIQVACPPQKYRLKIPINKRKEEAKIAKSSRKARLSYKWNCPKIPDRPQTKPQNQRLLWGYDKVKNYGHPPRSRWHIRTRWWCKNFAELGRSASQGKPQFAGRNLWSEFEEVLTFTVSPRTSNNTKRKEKYAKERHKAKPQSASKISGTGKLIRERA